MTHDARPHPLEKPEADPVPHPLAHPLVKIEDVSLRLASRAGPVDILMNVTLTINEGESVAIVGPSGSGKTSLLMVMAGLERVTAGHVQVAGQELTGLSEDGLARVRGQSIGIVFQAFHLVPSMTALENVALPLEFQGARDAFPRAQAMLEEVGLGARTAHMPTQLSGGEQQRVAIARALVVRPRLLLADEPTGNLDGKNGAGVIELLFDLRARHGATLVLVTHDATLAARAERVVAMADGRVVGGSERSGEAEA